MAFTLPEALRRLTEDCPLKNPIRRKAFEAGDLALGARAYAERGAHHGASGQWWPIWWEIQKLREKSTADAIGELTSEQCRWFAVWAMKHGHADTGIDAYRCYLRSPGEIGPFAAETALFLELLTERGALAEAVHQVDLLGQVDDDLYREELELAGLLLRAGETEQALRRFLPVRQRHHDLGDAWAMTAILSARRGDMAAAQADLAEAAKLGVENATILRDMLAATGASMEQWERMRTPWRTPEFDYEAQQKEWLSDPGFRIVPSAVVTPHIYGGSAYVMPACRGCGRTVREWFTIDLRAVPSLAEALAPWSLFPLLSCADCNMWVSRHDYEVDLASMSIRLVNVTASAHQFGTPVDTSTEVPRQHVGLKPLRFPQELTEELRKELQWPFSSVGGKPNWVQEPMRVFCRSCRGEMIYVASLTSTFGFDPYVAINEDGLLYHFACSRCRTISVIPQYT